MHVCVKDKACMSRTAGGKNEEWRGLNSVGMTGGRFYGTNSSMPGHEAFISCVSLTIGLRTMGF